MSCDFTHSALHDYFDGELSVVRTAEFKRHLAHCLDCFDELAALSSVRGALRHDLFYEPAPASLARKIRADLYSASPKISLSLHQAWPGLVVAAGLLFSYLFCGG
jgi:anti-sigma factor RsiW